MRAERGELRVRPKCGKGGTQLGDLGEGITDAAEFARVAQTILETTQDARNIADAGEQLAEQGETRRLSEQLAHEGLATINLSEIEGGGGEPTFQETGSSSGAGAVDGGEQ